MTLPLRSGSGWTDVVPLSEADGLESALEDIQLLTEALQGKVALRAGTTGPLLLSLARVTYGAILEMEVQRARGILALLNMRLHDGNHCSLGQIRRGRVGAGGVCGSLGADSEYRGATGRCVPAGSLVDRYQSGRELELVESSAHRDRCRD